MRKFLIVAMLAVNMLLVSCNKLGINPSGDNYDTSDSACVAEFVNSVTDPQLMSVDEALSLKSHMLEKQSIDSAFLALDDATINNVTTVLLKKHKTVSKKDIVDEYNRCNDVYINLPTKNVTQKIDPVNTDIGNKRDTGIISTSYNFRTDTINGKPVRIRITTTEAYE